MIQCISINDLSTTSRGLYKPTGLGAGGRIRPDSSIRRSGSCFMARKIFNVSSFTGKFRDFTDYIGY